MLQKYLFTLLAVMILTIAGAATGMAGPGHGCGDGGDGTGDGNGNCVIDEVDLTTAEIDWLLFMREEEKVARDSYLELGALWGLIVYENIAASEQRHMDAMKTLIDCYGLPDPVINEIGVFRDPELQALYDFLIAEGTSSVMAGLKVGALIEETDIEDIHHAIEDTDHMYIVSSYESLVCGSRNHLRAFIRQIEMNGDTYTPSVLDSDDFWDIAYSDMEQDCGVNKKGKEEDKDKGKGKGNEKGNGKS